MECLKGYSPAFIYSLFSFVRRCVHTSMTFTSEHIFSDVPCIIGCFGFSTPYIFLQVSQLRFIRPWLVSRRPASRFMTLLFLSTSILRHSLLHWWYCGWPSSFSLHRYSNCRRFCSGNVLQNPFVPLLLGYTLLSNQPASNHRPNVV